MARKATATVQLKLRMKEPLRARLAGAAVKRGVSLNSEVVHRLEESFRREEKESTIAARAAGGVYASFGGLQAFTLMRLLANAIGALEGATGKSWLKDQETFDRVGDACGTILKLFRPRGHDWDLKKLAPGLALNRTKR